MTENKMMIARGEGNGGMGVFIYRFMHATNFANNPLFNRYKVDSTMEYAYIFIFTCGFGLIFFQWN